MKYLSIYKRETIVNYRRLQIELRIIRPATFGHSWHLAFLLHKGDKTFCLVGTDYAVGEYNNALRFCYNELYRWLAENRKFRELVGDLVLRCIFDLQDKYPLSKTPLLFKPSLEG